MLSRISINSHHFLEGPMQRISQLHRNYDSLHYMITYIGLLLFPYGFDGYHRGIPHAIGARNMTPVEFYRYMLQIRAGHDNYIMKSRRLTQQYACDQYSKIEGERLNYIRYHQKEIRAEKYNGFMDALDNEDGRNAGRKIILPPTVYGSPRFYAEAFQDAMAIVRNYGKPSLFITFTCNPTWPEIKSSIFPGEAPSDRPDICVRVFHIKLEQLLTDLRKHQILGRVVAFTAVKEDQKRGLPHAHILIILHSSDQPRSPRDIDCIVCAEIPDKNINPELHEIITRNNIHGPCGAVNMSHPCMSGEGLARSCTNNFSQGISHAYSDHTINLP